MAKKLASEPRSYVRVTLERTVVQRRDIGILVDDPEKAGEAVLAMDAAHGDAGWKTHEVSEPTVAGTDHQLGVFDPNTGRLEPAR